MRKLLAAALLSPALACNALAAASFESDFKDFCTFVEQNYAYFDIKKTDWPRSCEAYRPRAAAALTRNEFITVLEQSLAELYDQHAHLNTSTPASPRLIPTNAMLWAVWQDQAAFVEAVRPGSSAESAGLKAGMQIVAVDGVPLHEAVAARSPRYLRAPDAAARSWALQTALAGLQNRQPVRLTVRQDGQPRDISYLPETPAASVPLSSQRLAGDIGYIRFNNSLGDNATVQAFDAALDGLRGTRGLVLDLRNTASGGNSLVARGIMGRLLTQAAPYQVHELVGEERAHGIRRRWVEYVMPRGEAYTAPVVVLSGHWTGSMGEGMSIGLNAARQAPVLGTPMAKLLGALDEIKLPVSGITVRIPSEKLFHVNGTPRENFLPCAVAAKAGNDADQAQLDAALALLTSPAASSGCRAAP